jgi:hypothetical protein
LVLLLQHVTPRFSKVLCRRYLVLQACLEGYTLSVAGLLGLGGRPDASQLIDGMQSIDHESGDKSGCEFMSQVRMKKVLDVAIHCAISFKCIVQAVFEIPIRSMTI